MNHYIQLDKGQIILPKNKLKLFLRRIYSETNGINSMSDSMLQIGFTYNQARNIINGPRLMFKKDVERLEQHFGILINDCIPVETTS